MVQQFSRNGYATALVLGTLCLALICGMISARWISTPFPGFFVMANQVIASVSLPHWPVAHHSHIYQRVVVAVNDQPVATSDELYAFVRHLPPGFPLTYTLEKDGHISQITLSSMTFTFKDYVLLFAVYLLTGVALVLIGVGVWFLKPSAPASQALLIFGLAGGIFALTGTDLYSPYWFFRLHVLAEAFFPAGLVHLALVFPVDRFRRYRSFLLFVPYLVALVLGAVYESLLYQPTAYSLIHNLCMVYAGIGGLALLGGVMWDFSTTASHLVRQRIRVILLGFISGFAFPAALMLLSGVTGGELAINYAGFTAFLFPLSLGYAIVKHDLFEIDALLKRGVYYLTLTSILTLTYIGLLAFLNLTVQSSESARPSLLPLLFTLAVALFLNPLKDYLQKGIDRVFFRLRYNPKKVLEVASASLASTLQLEEILSLIWHTINETMGVKQGGIFLLMPDEERYVLVYPSTGNRCRLQAEHPLVQRIQQKRRVFSLYDLADEALPPDEQEESHRGFKYIGAQLLMPLTFKGNLIGLLALGNKESGIFFSAEDINFLSILANQGALSITNALAYQEIQKLNTSLEQKVAERTQALTRTNKELHVSLERLEQTYRDLQRSKENLLQAEKMAALGRLAAGIAHEMNTPLGASLSSLKLLQQLVEEYKMSIGDPEMSDRDHQDIAAEMGKLVSLTQQWMGKAAAHIRSFKLHTRDLKRGEERTFSLLQTIENMSTLLSHRLRLSQCTLVVSCTSSKPILHGDPGKMDQVLTNLIVNAIDAYKDAHKDGGEIGIEINEYGNILEVRVSDRGSGIPPENIGKIFNEFFSTKVLGEGTGLGLSIARDIVTNLFGGTISVESLPGQGSVFILQLPLHGRNSQGYPVSEKLISQTW